jgi:hypothetical protein
VFTPVALAFNGTRSNPSFLLSLCPFPIGLGLFQLLSDLHKQYCKKLLNDKNKKYFTNERESMKKAINAANKLLFKLIRNGRWRAKSLIVD